MRKDWLKVKHLGAIRKRKRHAHIGSKIEDVLLENLQGFQFEIMSPALIQALEARLERSMRTLVAKREIVDYTLMGVTRNEQTGEWEFGINIQPRRTLDNVQLNITVANDRATFDQTFVEQAPPG